jgi:ADP-ribosylglycohydrolase
MAGNQIEIPALGPEARALGALMGMAVGDALGTTYEFDRIEQPPYPTLATGPATDVVGEGPFGLAAGQITDDTQMAICIARSVLAHDGVGFDRIDRADLAQRYVDWMKHAFDVGNQTGSSLRRIASGDDITSAGRAVWQGSGRRAAGNGSLMRTTPIGVLMARVAYPNDRNRVTDSTTPNGRNRVTTHSNDLAPHGLELLVEAALTDSLITHADPRCAIACAMFDAAIAAAITGRDAIVAARAALPIAANRLRELWRDDRDDLSAIDSGEADLVDDLAAALAAEPGVYGDLHVHRTAGFVRVAFRLAFWHFVHTPSWRAAVVDVASRGGDADTNGAIVGALLGARDGVAVIPPAWLDRVLGATQPGPDDWAKAHHPKHLLPLAALVR